MSNTRAPTALPPSASPVSAADLPQKVTDTGLDQLAAEMDDPSQWGDVEEVGPGFYRAPSVARDLAAAVSAYRAQHSLTQQQLGRVLSLHQSQIARLEAGQHTPAIETLVRLAQHLGLNLTIQITPTRASLTVAQPAQSDSDGASH